MKTYCRWSEFCYPRHQWSPRENINPIVSCFKTYIKDEWDFIRKLPPHVDYPDVLASCDVVSSYTSISHDLGLEALSY